MQIGIVGLGLIGGSLAKACKEKTTHRILGFDRDQMVCAQALADGAIDEILHPVALARCQLVLVALYPQAAVEYICGHGADFGKDTVVVDCCGVKQAVCPACEEAAKTCGFSFIGGHPMAGIEQSGYAFSTAGLFQGASMVLTPPADTKPETIQRISELCREIGFDRIQRSTPEEHDRMIALTSQLAHVLSSAYVKSPTALSHAGFSAGSFQDMTRVAKLNEQMWTELFFDNKPALLAELNGLCARLMEYADALQQDDRAAMERLLREGRLRKESL